MTLPPRLPPDEIGRVSALRACSVLDTPPEPRFDDITSLAALICGVPIALICLIDANRQWFKSRHGLEAAEPPRDVSFCSHAILQDDLFDVPNALEDERFRDNPLVTGEPHIRFYAGVPLTDPQGFNLGTLCVIDRVPRDLTAGQRDALGTLARQVVELLQMRRQMAALQQTQADLSASEERFRAFMDNSPAVAFMKDEEGRHVYVNEPLTRRFGLPAEQILNRTDADLWPEDVARQLQATDRRVMANIGF